MEQIVYVDKGFAVMIGLVLRRFVCHLVVVFVQLGKVVHYFVYFFGGFFEKFHDTGDAERYAFVGFGNFSYVVDRVLKVAAQFVGQGQLDTARVCLESVQRTRDRHRVVVFTQLFHLLSRKGQKLVEEM
jgi:hypothetical protein